MLQTNPTIFNVFGHFQNLNLLVLLDDLRTGRTARGAWASGLLLCPIAHGMPDGQLVGDLQYLSHAEELDRACDYAARHLGADPAAVVWFVDLWDSRPAAADWLILQLEALWAERLEDADAVQSVLVPAPLVAC